MKHLLRFLVLTSLFAASLLNSQAVLTAFTDKGFGGTSASWDIFYGSNYLPTFTFATGTAGNPSNSTGDLILTAVNPGYVSGDPFTFATGPVDSNGSTIPGNRDNFYTFFATPVNFSIGGFVAAGDTMSDFSLQALVATGSAGGISNIAFSWNSGSGWNNETIDSQGTTSGVNFYDWSGLSLASGTEFKVTWSTLSAHTALDAFQIQSDSVVSAVPEPSTYALMALGLAALLVCRRFKNRAEA